MKRTNCLIFICCALASLAFAQDPIKLPVDSAVRIGQLSNGLTYYIRHNEYPKQRCEFHIAQAVGAILEEDDQNGLAHFLEHMAFNGTTHFPDKGIIEYFEANGVNFGGNINAYTSIDQTVYRLSDVPTTREGLIDSALLVMHDWSCDLLLEDEEIDNERGVIREEWRTGNTAARRAWKHENEILFAGTQYAKRDVIGDTAVINNFSYEALRAYYKKWYGPDLQAIIVVGDVNVDQIEQKIIAMFDTIPARANRGERPYFELPDNDEPRIAIIRDKEMSQTRMELMFKHDKLPAELRGTNVDYILHLYQQLITLMMDNRMEEITMQPDAPAIYAGFGYDGIVKTKDVFYGSLVAKEGVEKEAFDLMLRETEKMRRYGFTNAELERAKTDLLSSYEKSYNERENTRNRNYAEEYIRHYLSQECIPGIAFEYEFVQQILPYITPEVVNALAASWVTDNNILVSITASTREEIKLPTEEEIVQSLVNRTNLTIDAPEEETLAASLVKRAPKAGKIKSRAYNEQLGTTEWILKNGVRVIIKPTAFKQDEILLTATSEGGLSKVQTPDLPSANLATALVAYSGIGAFDYIQLQKMLTGKVVSVNPSINDYTEGLDGSSSVKDFETMLQLVYLHFTAIRKDQQAYDNLYSMLDNQFKNMAANPQAAFRDSIIVMSKDHSERVVLWNSEILKQFDMNTAYRIFEERFANPADFTFCFTGNIDPSDKNTEKLICTWLGGLKTTKVRETYTDRGVRAPEGLNKNYFDREMTTRTASNRIQYTGSVMNYSLDLDLNMEMIGRILSTRYLESIREREGGSYGVGCVGFLARRPEVRPILIMQFDTDPLKQVRLMEIIHEEVMTIVNEGPLKTDLEKEKQSMLKDFEEDLEKNGYWDETILSAYYRREHQVNYIEEYKAAVERLTAETVQETLRQLVNAGNMFEVVMLPE